MQDEKLIELVRKYEFLYNLQHPKYMDSIKKEMAWKEISEQLKLPAAACKQRWQGLRDAYRRALNKRKSKSGTAAKKIKKWKYEDEMSFVTSFFVEKKIFESFELTSDDKELQVKDASTEVQNPNSDSENSNNDAVDVAASHGTEIRNEDDSIVRNKSAQPQHSQAKKAKTKRAEVPVQYAPAVLMSRLLDEQNIVPRQRENDEVDRFFLTMSETVKKFSPYLQALAKNKIFNLVSEMELQQLAPPATATAQYAYTPSPASTSSVQDDTPMPTKCEKETDSWQMYGPS